MMKRGLPPPPGSVGSLACPTCCTEGMNNSLTSDLPILLESLSTVPDLIDQCEVSSSSLESSSSSSINSTNPFIILNIDDFKISKFQSFEFSSRVPGDNFVYSLASSQLLEMEADCEDIKISSIGDDGGKSHQDSILQILTLISNQMMSNYQDLQNQLIQTESKFTTELQHITQENETFKQEICVDMQRIKSEASSPLVLSSLMNNTLVTSTVVPTYSTPQVTSSPVLSLNTNQDFQNQMMTQLSSLKSLLKQSQIGRNLVVTLRIFGTGILQSLLSYRCPRGMSFTIR
jgi:hypothetical protein